MAEEKKLLLDLSTNNSVGYVNILHEGKKLPYDLVRVKKLNIVEREKLGRLGLKLSSAPNIKTVKDENKYDGILLDILCLIIPSATRSILSGLPLLEKSDTVVKYMEVSGMVKKKVTPLRPGNRATKKRRK